MTEDEQLEVGNTLLRLWPRKFTDPELIDWGNRTGRYHLRDVLAALEEHKNSKPFAPRVSEILAKLRGKETDEAAAGGTPSKDSLVQAVRKSLGGLADMHDWEVALRYWRAVWGKYKADADQRARAAERGGSLIDLMDLPEEEKKTLKQSFAARAEAMAKLRAAQDAGKRVQVERGCVGTLVQAGMALEDARKSVEICFWPMREFGLGLGDVLMNTSAVETESVEVPL